ncbi:iron chaperone [Alloscardovia theropitheci]|uniref:Iron chaperone n=1 Tax=Alloscardovia theropitheci TaxID=2496842 RepID=A0A4V2MTZ7_9BIFI|nr:DUF1801 domain-containing protein [Alloscardovia theropitheci]TCD54369.1 iron chaperone [Alloscardovia theropitheci]
MATNHQSLFPQEFEEYLNGPRVPQTTQQLLRDALTWVLSQHPELDTRIAWNQPMFTHHGTFILGFSASSKHISVAPEVPTLEKYRDEFTERGYKCLKKTINLPLTMPIPFDLLGKLIDEQLELKKDTTSFWLPA